jgi:hypothetical protein
MDRNRDGRNGSAPEKGRFSWGGWWVKSVREREKKKRGERERG